MALSSDLISQFVKITNDKKEVPKETTVYGTTVDYNGKTYVQMDGSDLLTPVSTTTDLKPGERVTVMIKNHTATVTGNISSPSASGKELRDAVDTISEFEIIIAKKADVEALNAEKARIDTLTADNVTIKESLTANSADIDKLQASTLTITENLTAAEANITKLQTEKIDTIAADAKFATIENLEATDADIHNLEVTYGNFANATADQFAALRAEIEKLEAGEITVEQLKATFATIEQLNAEKARIDDLEAEVADIDTLIFGSATGDTIQSSFANAVIAQLGDAQIKSAMIDNVNASKVNAGELDTNKVSIGSGNLLISDETIQISDGTRVRVQVGKDASNDYSINVWDESGNLMFSKGGITDAAIKTAIIRNDMVSDTANIAAHKLDIDSLFEEINGSDKTIKSSRVYLDDQKQTLDVAFESMTTDIENLQNGVSSQGTQITAIQGQIAAKIWEQDISTAVNEVNETTDNLSTQYEEVVQDVNGLSATVSNHTSEISKKADSSTVTEVSNKVASMETDLSGFKTTVSDTYATKSSVDAIEIGGRNLVLGTSSEWSDWIIPPADKSNYTLTPYHVILSDPKEIKDKFAVAIEIEFSNVNASAAGAFDFRTQGTVDGGWNVTNIWSTNLVWLTSPPADGVYRYTVISTINGSNVNSTRFSLGFRADYWDGIGKFRYRRVKVEKGNKATDWSPAPEDLVTGAEVTDLNDRISAAETSISQNSTAINLRASKTELTKAVNDIAIGGRNLIRDSKLDKDTDMWTLDMNHHTISFANGYMEISRTYDESYTNRTFTLQNSAANPSLMPAEISGKSYVIQAELKAIDGIACSKQSTVFWRVYYDNSTSYEEVAFSIPDDLSSTEWRRCYSVRTFSEHNWTSSQVTLALANVDNGVCIRNIMLEEASKPSNWSLAPEDLPTVDNVDAAQSAAEAAEERAASAEALIQLISESIAMLVTDGNGQSLMTQTDDGWTFSTGDIQDKINAASQNLDNLTNEVGGINSAVGILQQAVNDLGILSEYVKITTYEGEPCIELGETDSDFKLLITNTRIMYMEGTGVPAYISNQSMYIKKAVVEQELQQGEFIWKARSNGNLGLIWKGGD